MRELPILMNGAMVRAVLDGRKTVTRRKVDRVTGLGPVAEFGTSTTPGYDWHFRDKAMLWHDLKDVALRERCPYGQVGDRLYVRETTMVEPHPSDYGMTESDMPNTWASACEAAGSVYYRADATEAEQIWLADAQPWTPSIHMPKERARIWLEVTDVRVERVQDITDEQARCEGVQLCEGGAWDYSAGDWHQGLSSSGSFATLWDSINGAGSSADNPWVWVVEFKRVEVG